MSKRAAGNFAVFIRNATVWDIRKAMLVRLQRLEVFHVPRGCREGHFIPSHDLDII